MSRFGRSNDVVNGIDAFQVHAFSKSAHGGNPAGVCLLNEWLRDDEMRRIAEDLGPSVTAFVLRTRDGVHAVRSFTRGGREVESFCGHATFSAAHILLNGAGEQRGALELLTSAGPMRVGRSGEYLTMSVPYWELNAITCPQIVLNSLGVRPAECYRGPRDLLLVFESEAQVQQLQPRYEVMRALGPIGLIASAVRSPSEIMYRFFCPGFSISENEDHATGSALSSLGPFWAARLGRSDFAVWQASARGGSFLCHVSERTVTIASQCTTFLVGTIKLAL